MDYNGTDSFTYRVIDRGDPDNCAAAPCDAAETSSTATVSITVDPVNDAPVATAGSRTTDEDTPLTLDLPGWRAISRPRREPDLRDRRPAGRTGPRRRRRTRRTPTTTGPTA